MKLPSSQAIIAVLRTGIKRTMIFFGGLFFCLWALSFTDLPYYAYHSLGTAAGKLKKEPHLIVLLGGSGMPSPDGFMRCYYASKAAKKYPQSNIIIALPFNETDSLKQLNMMLKELVLRGIDSLRISFEPQGFNTYSQAQNIAKRYQSNRSALSVLIVTSPEHMYRAVKTFRLQGFQEVGGEPSFEIPPDEEQIKDKQHQHIESLSFRYNMWSYLNYELLVLREYTAIAYYWMRGWL